MSAEHEWLWVCTLENSILHRCAKCPLIRLSDRSEVGNPNRWGRGWVYYYDRHADGTGRKGEAMPACDGWPAPCPRCANRGGDPEHEGKCGECGKERA